MSKGWKDVQIKKQKQIWHGLENKGPCFDVNIYLKESEKCIDKEGKWNDNDFLVWMKLHDLLLIILFKKYLKVYNFLLYGKNR